MINKLINITVGVFIVGFILFIIWMGVELPNEAQSLPGGRTVESTQIVTEEEAGLVENVAEFSATNQDEQTSIMYNLWSEMITLMYSLPLSVQAAILLITPVALYGAYKSKGDGPVYVLRLVIVGAIVYLGATFYYGPNNIEPIVKDRWEKYDVSASVSYTDNAVATSPRGRVVIKELIIPPAGGQPVVIPRELHCSVSDIGETDMELVQKTDTLTEVIYTSRNDHEVRARIYFHDYDSNCDVSLNRMIAQGGHLQ